MKLLYDEAWARQIIDTKTRAVDASATGRRPMAVASGTQRKLLNPKTKMLTPVNCTTSAKLLSYFLINAGNMGASDNGPMAWANETHVAQKMAENFHQGLQLRGSAGSSDGCGTRTLSVDLTK